MPCLDMNVFSDSRARFEFLAILVGMMNITFTATTYWYRSGNDQVYLAVVCLYCFASINYILLQLISVVQNHWPVVKFYEMIFHWLFAVVLLFESINFLITTLTVMDHGSCGGSAIYLAQRYLATACGFVSSFIYGFLALSVTRCSVNNTSGQVTCNV